MPMLEAREIPNGATDFDFLIGRWSVEHRRLKERLSGCGTWETFGGTCIVNKVLGGLGNVDDNVIELPEGPYRAVTLRSFDPVSGQWTIWWLDGRTPNTLDAPLVGRFSEQVGTFHGQDKWQDTPVLIRFLWTTSEANLPQWEQAFSPDGGVSWETNWVMNFTPLP